MTLDKFDALGDWVEKGKAPDEIVETVDPANKDVPASWSPSRTRPLCPWPQYGALQGRRSGERSVLRMRGAVRLCPLSAGRALPRKRSDIPTVTAWVEAKQARDWPGTGPLFVRLLILERIRWKGFWRRGVS